MDAGQQASLAPLYLPSVGTELPTHHRAFGFESCQRNFDIAIGQAERGSERGDVYGPQTLQAIAQNFDQRVIACPRLPILSRCFNPRRALGQRKQRVEFGQALRSNEGGVSRVRN